MSAPVQAPAPTITERKPWLSSLHPGYRLLLRWAFIAAVTTLAFHRSLISLVDTTRSGGLNGYIWVVPVAAALAAIGVALHHRTELPIHDRQTDVIVGIMGLVFALLLHAVLLGRYELYFHLLRLDLLALWAFVLSSCIALFGLRPVTRFAWVWVLLLAVFPLPYHLTVMTLGGSRTAAGIGTMIIAAAATGIAVGRHPGRGLVGALAAWGVGLVVLAVMSSRFPTAPLLAFQMIPAVTAIALVGATMFALSRRDPSIQPVNRKTEPLAAKQVWSALPVVLVVGIALSLVRLPSPAVSGTARVDALRLDTPLSAPAGWHVVDTATFPWVSRLYGDGVELVRQEMVSDVGDARFDKLARPRAVVVDQTTTPRPFALSTFPARLLYRVQGIRVSTAKPVDLGYGITGDLLTAVDDGLLVTWYAVEWTWAAGDEEQRVMVISVDNHDDNAPFPQPTGGILPTMNTLFTVLFRGNAAVSDLAPNIKDTVLLTEFSRGLVRAQLEPLRVQP